MASHRSSVSLGGLLIYKLTKRLAPQKRTKLFKMMAAFLTYVAYLSYTMLRRAFVVAIPTLKDGSSIVENGTDYQTQEPWAPFDEDKDNWFIAALNLLFLSVYAVGMFAAGRIANKTDLRYCLVVGLGLSSLFCWMFGLAKFFKIHNCFYFLASQILAGLAQCSGWPATLTCVGNWFGFGNRGFILGIWNTNSAVGNVLGSVIAGSFVDEDWSLCFSVLAGISGGVSLMIFLFLVPRPSMVRCLEPEQHANIEDTMGNEKWKLNDQSLRDAAIESLRMASEDDPLMETSGQSLGIIQAMKVPGVIEYSLCVFFNKLVYQSFVNWLPNFIEENLHSTNQEAANLSVFFDIGGLIGGIAMGIFSDWMGERSSTSAIAILLGAPVMFLYKLFSRSGVFADFLLFMVGLTIGGTQVLITTAATCDLGTHRSLKGNTRALATISAVIGGFGACGAALGAGACFLMDAPKVLLMLIISDLLSLLFLTRLIVKTIREYGQQLRKHLSSTG